METRTFRYGGLAVTLFKAPQHGWITTMAELAKGCGVDKRTIERLIPRHGLVRKGSVIEDSELATKTPLIHSGRGPKPSLFWTTEGMTFVAMLLRTEQCEQFREEVLHTIKELEQQGFVNSQEVMQMIKSMQEQIVLLQQQQEHFIQKIWNLENENAYLKDTLSDFSSVQASLAGRSLAAQKQTRHLRH